MSIVPPLSVEYAKSARASCKSCKDKIEKGQMRIGSTLPGGEYDMVHWYHLQCFGIPNSFGQAKDLTGFNTLKKEDKAILEEYFECVENRGTKAKAAPKTSARVSKVMKELNQYAVRDLQKFLVLNEQKKTGTKVELVARVADGMVNGRAPKCPKCTAGNLEVDSRGLWKCKGYFDDDHFRRCSYKYQEGQETIPVEGIVVRSPWKQHATEKDDALEAAGVKEGEVDDDVIVDKVVVDKTVPKTKKTVPKKTSKKKTSKKEESGEEEEEFDDEEEEEVVIQKVTPKRKAKDNTQANKKKKIVDSDDSDQDDDAYGE